MKIQANYNLLDITKMIMAFMVIGIHVKMNSVCAATVPTILEYIMGSAVSFFFITSGFLLQSKIIRKNNSRTVLKGTFIRILRLYIIWILLYLPISIIYYNTNDQDYKHDILEYLRGVFFIGETAYACTLWYLLALAVSLLFIYILYRLKLSLSQIWVISILLMIIGYFIKIHSDSDIPMLRNIAKINSFFFSSNLNRNGLYYGFAHVSTGMMIRAYFSQIRNGFIAGFLCLLLSYIMFIYNIPFYYLLAGCGFFLISISYNPKSKDIYHRIRIDSMFVFLIHMYIIYIMISIFPPNMYKDSNYYVIWIIIFIISLFISEMAIYARNKPRFKWINYLIE